MEFDQKYILQVGELNCLLKNFKIKQKHYDTMILRFITIPLYALGKFSYVGQNMYYSWTSNLGNSGAPWENAVNSWYNEVHDFIQKGEKINSYQ